VKQVHDALETSDVIVLGSPVYFGTVSAQVKLMIDLSSCLMPYIRKANGTFGFERRAKRQKKGVFIAVAGTDQEFNVVLTTVKVFFNWTNTKLVETFFYSHDDNELGVLRMTRKR